MLLFAQLWRLKDEVAQLARLGVVEGVEEVTGREEEKEDEEEPREAGSIVVMKGTNISESAIDSLYVAGFFSGANG